MLPFKSIALAACLTSIASFGASLSAYAEATGADGHVNIFNSTPGFTITGFYTNAGHGWTRDWLTDVVLTPGVGAKAVFSSAPPKCHQHIRAGWLSTAGREFHGHPIHINICEVSNIYFAEDEIFFD
ncbi:MAG: hypothetical protein AAFN44_08440 [Pseudomonadota bacterium]